MRSLIAIVALILTAAPASAAETNFSHYFGGGADAFYHYPEIEPEVHLSAGYRYVSFSGSKKAAEYEHPDDSLILGGKAVLFPFPHRAFLELNMKGAKDYFVDMRYAYRDMVLSRWMNRTLYHNLDNVVLKDLDSATSSPGIKATDAGKDYGRETGMNSLFLRLKTPHYPFHVYFDGWRSQREGAVQQRSLQGSGWYTGIVRASQRRDIDIKTLKYTAGVNAHLGPVEADYSHSQKSSDINGDNVLYDSYGANTFRAAGTYPHNLIPETREFSDTFKLHTSYTGKLVASASVSLKERENRESGAKADYFTGTGAVTWMPKPRVAFFLRYNRREARVENGDTATIVNTLNPLNSYTFAIRQSLSSTTDAVSLTGRYKPLARLTIRAKYAFENVSRDNAEDWGLQDKSQTHTASLSANVKLLKGLDLKADYMAKGVDAPAYNTVPAYSDEGSMSLSWAPHSRVNTLVCYGLAVEERESINREVRTEKAFGSGTFLLTKRLSLTASYAHFHNQTELDLGYGTKTDSGVPYEHNANVYAADLGYVPAKNLNLAAGVAHTLSSSSFTPGSIDLIQTVSVASFSESKTAETVYSASGDYKFKNGFGLGVDCKFREFDDTLDNPHDDVEDGDATIVMITVAKKW